MKTEKNKQVIEDVTAQNSLVTANASTIEQAVGNPVKPKQISMVAVALVVALLLVTGVAGYYAGKMTPKDSGATPTPTPTEATATPTVPETVTPTSTATPTVTVSATATVTPTVSYVSKTATLDEFGGDYQLKFTMSVPSDVTVIETKVSSWDGIVLKRGAKNFMAFNLPYELYEIQGYSSVTPVASDRIANLRRVRSKKVFSNSGTYSFAVAYVTTNMLASGTDCTAPVISDPTTSPCATPALAYSAEVGFSAYCSIDPAYIAICDKVMKTIKVVKN